MNPSGRFPLAFLPAVLLALWVFAAHPPAEAEEILPLDEVKPGMKGKVRTVFRGTKISTFDFEVVDVLRAWLPGQDVILVKCSGGEVDQTGIASGMSGSPCTVDGKLMGALSYTWNWSKVPLAGITPIEAMLAVANRPREKKVEFPRRGGETMGFQAIETPLFVSARSPRAFRFLQERCKPFALHPVGGGGGGGAFKDLDAKLEPGAAIGVLLMDGDMEAYAVGTVTWTDGKKILAFGHSFNLEGEYSLPVTNAWTYTTVSRLPGSFKMSATGKTLGALVQDQQAGILCRLGENAPLVPLDITVRNPKIDTEKSYAVRIAKHKNYTPMIASFALRDALDAAEPGPGEVSQEVVLRFKPKGHDEVSVRMFFSKDEGWWGRNFMSPLTLFLNNEFEETEVEWIKVDAEIVHEGKTGRLTGFRFEKREFHPGETITLHVEVTPYRKKPLWVTVKYTLPATLKPGKYTIGVRPADEAPLSDEAPMPEDVDTLLQAMKILNQRRADRLVVVLDRPGFILQHKGRRFYDLPPAALFGLLSPTEAGGFRIDRRVWKSPPKEVGLFLAGSRSVNIEVKERVEKN
ncbi:MAG: hypothetical protein ACYS47_07930 [Planctomycetota bacterium]|jgi:hypothetical protein